MNYKFTFQLETLGIHKSVSVINRLKINVREGKMGILFIVKCQMLTIKYGGSTGDRKLFFVTITGKTRASKNHNNCLI